MRAFAALYPTRPPSRSAGTWDQACGVLMVEFGAYLGGATLHDFQTLASTAVKPFWLTPPTRSIATAADVLANSGIASTDPSLAPVGAWHLWDRVINDHVGQDADGGGTRVFMATDLLDESLGSDIGFASVATYSRRGRYRGWTTNYSGGQVSLPTEPTALNVTPLEASHKTGDDMSLFIGAKIPTDATQVPPEWAGFTKGGYVYAICGLNPGTFANALETQDGAFANAIAADFLSGHFKELSWPSYVSWVRALRTPAQVSVKVDTSGIQTSSDGPQTVAALQAIKTALDGLPAAIVKTEGNALANG